MRAWPSSLRSRLTLWYAALLALPLVAFALLCYFVFARTLLHRTDNFIGDALSAFSRELVAERRTAGTVEAAMQHDRRRSAIPGSRDRHSRFGASGCRDDGADGRRSNSAGTPTPVSKIGSTIVASIHGYDMTSPLAVTVASDARDVSRDLAPTHRCADSRSDSRRPTRLPTSTTCSRESARCSRSPSRCSFSRRDGRIFPRQAQPRASLGDDVARGGDQRDESARAASGGRRR